MYIFLDSAPLSTLASPARTPEISAILKWAKDCGSAGHNLFIPEIVDYEVRRELLRSKKTSGLKILDTLQSDLTYVPLTTQAMLLAAELWAQTRQQGKPTSHDENIDVDVILAAQAMSCGLPVSDIVIATVNPRHLSLFVNADIWSNIVP
jgi:predicted nucleic acid-binding protein